MFTDSTLRLLFHFPASSHALTSLLEVLAISQLDPTILDSLISTLPTSLLTEFFDRAKNVHSSTAVGEQHGQQRPVEHASFSLISANVIADAVFTQLSPRIQFCASLIQWGGVSGEFWLKCLLNTPEKYELFRIVVELPLSEQNLLVRSVPFVDPSVFERDIAKPWLGSKFASIIISTARELILIRQGSERRQNDSQEQQLRRLMSQLQENVELLRNICRYGKEMTSSANIVVQIREMLFKALVNAHPADQKRIFTLIAERRPNELILVNMLGALFAGII